VRCYICDEDIKDEDSKFEDITGKALPCKVCKLAIDSVVLEDNITLLGEKDIIDDHLEFESWLNKSINTEEDQR